MHQIVFLQPALPNYRHGFFTELRRLSDSKISVYASDVDFLGVKSIDTSYLNKVGRFIKLGPFFWQKGFGVPKLRTDDILVISGNPRILNYMLLLFLFRIRGNKVIWWGQGWTAGSRGLFAHVRRLMMNLASGVVVYTDKESEELNLYPPVVGLNNGLDLRNVVDIKDHITERAPGAPLNLLFIGRLTEKSRIDKIVDIIVGLDFEVKLHVVGDHGEFKGLFPELYVKSIESENIRWYGAVFNEKDIADIAIQCDYFIYGGAVGLSLIHAYCYYLPAIVHDSVNDHMPEFSAFEEGYNGYLFKENDSRSLVDLLSYLSRKNSCSMRFNARSTVSSTYNTRDMAQRFISLIDAIK